MSSIDSKIVANKSKNESIENKLQELEKHSAKSHWNICLVTIYRFGSEDGTPAYLTFQPVQRYFKLITITKHVAEWKSKGLFDESIKPFTTSDNSLAPVIIYYGYKIRLKFNGSVLRQPKVTYTHKKAVNVYIVYELTGSNSHSDDPTLKNCLFGAVMVTKNADIDKYECSGYENGFDRKSFHFQVVCLVKTY